MSIHDIILHGTYFHEMRKLSDRHRRSLRRSTRTQGKSERRVRRLEEDVGYLTLVLASILTKLDESGTLSRADLKASMDELDEFDGIKDGRLNVSILRGATGDGDDEEGAE